MGHISLQAARDGPGLQIPATTACGFKIASSLLAGTSSSKRRLDVSRKTALGLALVAGLVGFVVGGLRTGSPVAWLGDTVAVAATPLGTAFTYQGRLVQSGTPANGNFDLQFTLYDAVSGGVVAGGPITQANVAVQNGLFTVQLDFGSAAFAGDSRFLQVGVRPGGTTGAFTLLSPRQSLTASPYALYAVNAATADSVTTGCPRRKYYMTSATPSGANATTACVAGYHMASFAEIMDPSQLEYAMDLVASGQAHTLPDAGSGPPFSSLAFVRTGVSGSTNTVPGNANCASGGMPWKSNLGAVNGTVIALKPTWSDASTNVSPWDATVHPCDNVSPPDATPPVHVWCVQD